MKAREMPCVGNEGEHRAAGAVTLVPTALVLCPQALFISVQVMLLGVWVLLLLASLIPLGLYCQRRSQSKKVSP